MKALRIVTLAVFLFGLLACPIGLSAQESAGHLLMFRPQHVEATTDLPAELAGKYPHRRLIVITFQPMTHAAAKDGSNLKEGQGSWLDRGMKPSEPGRIRLLVPEDDPNLLGHTLKVSDGPFIFRVKNSDKGFFETVPFVSPHFEVAR